MAQLNYNHLHYFWVVATLGSIVKAAQALHVTPQTISGQIRTLEERVGSRLFRKQGRRLQLTDMGQLVRSYAEPMFVLGAELVDALRSGGSKGSGALRIGITANVPKSFASKVIGAALDSEPRLVCCDASSSTLAADLAARSFDVVLSDGPIRTSDAGGIANNAIGECDTTLLCRRRDADRYHGHSPKTLEGAPFILPPRRSRLRRTLSHWLRSQKLAPLIVAEIENLDLMAAVSEANGGLFAAPTTVVADLEARYDVARVCQLVELKQQFYLIAPEATNELGSVQAIVRAAREQFLAPAAIPVALGSVGPAPSAPSVARERVRRPTPLNGLPSTIRVASLGQLPHARPRWNGEALPIDGSNAK